MTRRQHLDGAHVHQVTPTARYRAYLRPIGLEAAAGVLPFVQVKAVNAEHAMRAAHAVTGHPVEHVERLEGEAPPACKRPALTA